MVQSVETVLQVDPQQGDDRATGEASAPVKTIGQALRLAVEGTVIRLSEGRYTAESGEEFPLRVPAGVTLIGNVNTRGAAIVISGGGAIDSPAFGQQTVTLALEAAAQLRGITLTNPLPQGTGIWVEFAEPLTSSTIAHCTIVRCEREGIFVAGAATPAIAHCLLQANRAGGIAFVRYAKGEVRRCTILENRFGIVLSDRSAPLLIDNQISQNQTGILVSGTARPVLRQNAIVHNSRAGLAVSGAAQPNLGTPSDPAHNRFQENGAIDLHNQTAMAVITVGNQLSPLQVKGVVNFLRVSSAVLPQSPSQPINPVLPLRGSSLPTIAIGLVEPSQLDSYLSKNYFIELMRRTLPEAADREEPTDRRQDDREDSFLTRLEAIALLTQHLGLITGNLALLDVYRDRAQIPSHFAPRVAAATQKRLVVLPTQENRLQPLQPIRQVEAAAMVDRALALRGEVANFDRAKLDGVPLSPTNVAFGDIQDHWAADYIRAIAAWGAIAGNESGNFMPDQPLSSLEYAQVLRQIFGKSSEAGKSLDGERSPQSISRLQVWQSLLAELRSLGLDFPTVNLTLLDRYEDAALSDAAQAAIALATQLRLVFNYPQLRQLRPNHAATRAEIAAIVYQGLVFQSSTAQSAIVCPYLIDPDRANQPQPRLPNAPRFVLLELDQDAPVSLEPISLINQPVNPPETVQIDLQTSVQAIADAVTSLLQAQDIRVLVRSPNLLPNLSASLPTDSDSQESDSQESDSQNAEAKVSITLLSPNLPDRSGIAVFYPVGSIASARLAQALHKTILRSLDLPSRGVHADETADLPSIPTARLEIGILSYGDRFAPSDSAYCQAVGQAIGAAIGRMLD